MRLSLHVITQDRQDRMLRLLDRCHHHFDVIRVCDGASNDHTKDICEVFGAKVYKRAWDDNMSAQHNLLLKQAKKGEWIYIMDDDELPTWELLGKLRQYAKESNNGFNYKIVKTTSIMVLNGVGDWLVPDLIKSIEAGEQENIDRFTKLNFFLYDGEVRYSGESHYGLEWEQIKTWGVRDMVPEPYLHYKTPLDVVECNIQQAFINPEMQGIPTPHALELQKLFLLVGIHTSHQMLDYLRRFEISPELKKFFIIHRDPRLGTVSDYFEYYFLYHHPEELEEWLDAGFSELGDYAFRDLTKESAVIRHLKDLGGYRSYTVDIEHEDGTEHWLPIAHLGLHPELWALLDTNQVLIGVSNSVDSFNLDPLAAENQPEEEEMDLDFRQDEVDEDMKRAERAMDLPEIGHDDDDFQTIS